MRRLLALIFLTTLSIAQTQTPAPKAAAMPGPNDVPMTAKVLEIKGVCDTAAPKTPATPCETSLTRAQFETLWNTFNRQPGGGPVVDQPAAARRSTATTYGTMAIMSQEARKRGLE